MMLVILITVSEKHILYRKGSEQVPLPFYDSNYDAVYKLNPRYMATISQLISRHSRNK